MSYQTVILIALLANGAMLYAHGMYKIFHDARRARIYRCLTEAAFGVLLFFIAAAIDNH